MDSNALLAFVSDHLTGIGVAFFLLIASWRVQARRRRESKAKKELKLAKETGANEPVTLHPEVDPAICAGCEACVRVCPEGDILKIVDHKAVLVSPSKCVGHGECEQACPVGAITLVFGTRARGMDIPRISSDYETNVPGLYIAGELGGMGLIRNAVKQGRFAIEHAAAHLRNSATPTDTDILVIGAGPAGLSAALTALTKNKRYLWIEQGKFGGTILNFPRQKVVMTQPAELAGIGLMKFSKNIVSKEDLLSYWQEVSAKTGLKVQENTRFETLSKQGDVFQVKTSRGVITAKKVILCTGVRGTPRKLGLPNEDLPKVTYNLTDPEQYQRRHVAIVGGGNAAVEAAQYLAREEYGNTVTLVVRGKGLDRTNEQNKNLIMKLAERGRVKILWETSVGAIETDRLILKTPHGDIRLPNHYLFIFAGAEQPHAFLMSLGIQIDKKFGEALKRAG